MSWEPLEHLRLYLTKEFFEAMLQEGFFFRGLWTYLFLCVLWLGLLSHGWDILFWVLNISTRTTPVIGYLVGVSVLLGGTILDSRLGNSLLSEYIAKSWFLLVWRDGADFFSGVYL